jgi:hypothetical protein
MAQVDPSFESFDEQIDGGPPDPEFAISSNWIVGVTNHQIGIFAKSITNPNPTKQSWPQFFPLITHFFADPVAHFDEHSQRFFVAIFEQLGSSECFLHLAVSDDANSNSFNDWVKIEYPLTATYTDPLQQTWPLNEFDFTRLAVDGSRVYISGFFRDPAADGPFHVLYIFDKASILAGTPSQIGMLLVPQKKIWAPVQSFGTPPSAQYLLEGRYEPSVTHTSVVLHTPVAASGGGLVYASFSIPTTPYQSPNSLVNQILYPGGALSTIDARILSAQHRDGYIWAVHNILKADGRTVVRWYQIDPDNWPQPGSNPHVVLSGDIDDPTIDEYTFMPSIAVSPLGHAAITYSRCANIIPGSGEPTNQPAMWRVLKCSEHASFGPQTLVKDSVPIVVPIPGLRWGDYCDTLIDPGRPLMFWGHGEWHMADVEWKTQTVQYTVECASDWNRDGVVDLLDEAAALELFLKGDEALDLDGDGVLTPDDLLKAVMLQKSGK